MLPRQSDETNIEEYFELQNTKLYLSFSVKFKTKIYVHVHVLRERSGDGGAPHFGEFL